MLLLLGLIATLSYISGFTGASIPTQWVLFSAILPFGLWRTYHGSRLPLIILPIAIASILWAPNTFDSIYGLWILSLWALAFWLGSTYHDFTPLWQGMAIGLYINSTLAIAQAFGFTVIQYAPGNPAGLLFNSTLLGATCAIVIIGLWSHGLYWWIHGIVPALVLSNSRGAYIALAIVFITRYIHWTAALLCVILGATLLSLHPSGSDTLRLLVWGTSIPQLSTFGNGLGSFTTYLFSYDSRIYYPERMHNDYLQLIFELGIGAIPILSLYLIALTQRASPNFYPFLAFATLGLFYFPLWAPATALVGCLLAGRLCADWHLLRNRRLNSGPDGLPGYDYQRSIPYRQGSAVVPLIASP